MFYGQSCYIYLSLTNPKSQVFLLSLFLFRKTWHWLYTSRGNLLIFWMNNDFIKVKSASSSNVFPFCDSILHFRPYIWVFLYILREYIMWYMYKCCGQTNLRKMSSLYWTPLAPCSQNREVRGLSVPPWTNKRSVINGPCCSPPAQLWVY